MKSVKLYILCMEQKKCLKKYKQYNEFNRFKKQNGYYIYEFSEK